MTKAQYRVYQRLAKKQVNRQRDVQVVEENTSSVTFRVAFPPLYLTYNDAGTLVLTETEQERIIGRKRVLQADKPHVVLQGELGSSDYRPAAPIDDDDDSVPF